MTEADLIVKENRPGWWSAACRHCGVLITKHDHTREECVGIALACGHTCNKPGQMGLL